MTKNDHKQRLLYPLFVLQFLLCFALIAPMISFAQTSAEIEGMIFSKRSTPGYNLLMTNTDETKSSDLTMYSGGSSITLLHHGGAHPNEPNNNQFRFSNDLIFSSYASDFMRILSNGNVGIGTSTPNHRLTSQVSSGENITSAIEGVNNNGNSGDIVGVRGISQGNGVGSNFGTVGRAHGTQGTQCGIYGWSDGTENITRYAVYGVITGESAGTRYAVYGDPPGHWIWNPICRLFCG